jgi:hypothetical protein
MAFSTNQPPDRRDRRKRGEKNDFKLQNKKNTYLLTYLLTRLLHGAEYYLKS